MINFLLSNLETAALVILILIVLVLIFTLRRISRDFREFMADNIQEAIIISGEDISEKIKALNKANQELERNIMKSLAEFSRNEASNNDKIIPEIKSEVQAMLRNLSASLENYAQNQEEHIKKFDDEVARFVDSVNKSVNNIEESGTKQRELLAEMITNLQGVLNTSTADIQSAFNATHDELMKIMKVSMQQINEDYEKNLTNIFQAMADNLASIHKILER